MYLHTNKNMVKSKKILLRMAGTKANVVLSPIGLFIIPIRRLHLICHTHVASKNQWLTPTIFKMNYYLKKGGSSDNDPFRSFLTSPNI